MVKMFNQVAEGKRRGIARSNKAMFLWIAGISAIVGVCLVLSIFLINQLAFHGKVVARQVDTLSTISKNKTTLVDLRNNLRAKDANTRLNALKATSDEKGLQVILDALPSSENSLALGASLQEKIAGQIPGLAVESLTLGAEVATLAESTGSTVQDVSQVPFAMNIVASDSASLQSFLQRLESSIRTVDIDQFSLEKNSTEFRLSLLGHAYYKPAKALQLNTETVRP